MTIMISRLTRTIWQHEMGVLPMTKTCNGRLRVVLSVLVLMLSHSLLAQTVTVSPNSWTKPTSSIYYSGQTYRTTTDDGSTWMEAKAVANSDKTVTVYVRKNSGTLVVKDSSEKPYIIA